jgi:hypothetical protein
MPITNLHGEPVQVVISSGVIEPMHKPGVGVTSTLT